MYKGKGIGVQFALVHDVFGYWTLAKGRIEGEESLVEEQKEK